MIRKTFFLSQSQITSLEQISQATGISESEHVRSAIDGYIVSKLDELRPKASVSPSYRKEAITHG